MLIDTHCHFEKQYYDDFDEILNNAKLDGVTKIIASGCSKSANAEALEFAQSHENVYTTIGFHPDQAEVITFDDLFELKKQIQSSNKVVGIGEIGLDYHYEGYNKEHQFDLFEKQLFLAQKYDLPVVIHSRDATQDTIDILKKYSVKGVIHSFSGSYEVAKIYIDMGYKLGINGVVTFKNCNLRDTLKKIDPENIVFETDSPYMTPEPYRGTKNESKNIKVIANYVAGIYGISTEKLAEITSKNATSVFDM